MYAFLNLWFHNFGRTPAFAKMVYVGAAFAESAEIIRIDPGARLMLQAELDYPRRPSHDPFAPREVRFAMEVRGAMSGSPLDVIEWRGEITLLLRDVGGWHLNPNSIRVNNYIVTRSYPSEPA